MAKKKTNKSDNTALEVGLAVAGLAAIAGGVFLYGTDAGKKKRKEIKGWTLKMKGEVIEKLENAKEISEEKYHDVVDTVAAKYKKLKTVTPEELEEIVDELKKSWKHIVKASQAKAPKKASTKKVSKKSAKKTTKSKK